jgi:hypothetical protein
MRSRIAATVLLCLVSSSAFSPPTQARSRPSDTSYPVALAAANRFLHAWQMEDHETGIMMLTDSARQQASPTVLQQFFSPGPQAAYEIAHGKRLRSGTYSFPVVLFGASPRPRYLKIVVIQRSRNDWLIDKFPA